MWTQGGHARTIKRAQDRTENPEAVVADGDAIPGRCVVQTEQAPISAPCSPNPFNKKILVKRMSTQRCVLTESVSVS